MTFEEFLLSIRDFFTGTVFPALGTFATSRVFPALIIAVVGILIIKILLRVLKAALSHLDKAFTKLLLAVVRPILYLILGLIVTASLGIDVTSIVALASVLTLAISLSLQSALGNVFGGFTLLYTKPFHEGDYVEIAGQSGTVKEVGLAYTRLATPDNKLVYIPNSAVVAAEIVNYTVTGTRRVDIAVNVAYSADPETVTASLLEAANISQVLADPAPTAVLSEYGEGYVTYSLKAWTKTDDYWDVKFAISKNIKDRFAEKGIDMSASHMNVRVIQ